VSGVTESPATTKDTAMTLPNRRLSLNRRPVDDNQPPVTGHGLEQFAPLAADRPVSVHPNTSRELEELIIKAFYLAHDIAGLAQHDKQQLHNLNGIASMVLRQWAITQGSALDAMATTDPAPPVASDVPKFG
jgi:hypothetical protein